MSVERTLYERELEDEAENLRKLQGEKEILETEISGHQAALNEAKAELAAVNWRIARSEAVTETVKRLMDMLE